MKTDTNKPRIYKENEDSKTLYVEMGKGLESSELKKTIRKSSLQKSWE